MIKQKPVIFLIITFLWSWIYWIIGLDYLSDGINRESIQQFIKFFFIGVYGPFISSIITTLYFDGYTGLITLLKKLIIWKYPLKNYLIVIILPLVFVIIGIGLYALFLGEIGVFDQNAVATIPAVLWAGLYAGPLGEELGWRGLLLPELQKEYSMIKSALIIGFIWFCWHIPLFWAPFGTLVSGEPLTFLTLLTYLVMLICLSVIITWLVNTSKGSVLIAILFHLSINAGIALLFFPDLAPEFKKVHLLSGIPMLLFTLYLVLRVKKAPLLK